MWNYYYPMFKFEIYSIYFREISIWYPWPEINNYNVVMTNINLLYAIWSIYKISLFIVIIFFYINIKTIRPKRTGYHGASHGSGEVKLALTFWPIERDWRGLNTKIRVHEGCWVYVWCVTVLYSRCNGISALTFKCYFGNVLQTFLTLNFYWLIFCL